MASTEPASCENLQAAGYNQAKAAWETWASLLTAGAFEEAPDDDPFVLASGQRATLKVNAEALYDKPAQFAAVLGHVATYPCVREADVLTYVPNGMRQFATILGDELGKPVAHVEKVPDSTVPYSFRFVTPDDRELALAARRPRILEDVVTTLGSVAGVAKLLDPGRQDIHALALLLRGKVNPAYRQGITDHYLVHREIPLNKEGFLHMLTPEEQWLYKQGRR